MSPRTTLAAAAFVASLVATPTAFVRADALTIATVDAASQAAGDPSERIAASIAALIERLGSDDYSVRRRAEEQLLAVGADAYDQLRVAENSDDLEIASRAQYILQQLRIEWVRTEDPAEVRRALSGYGELSIDARLVRLRRLARLPDLAGVAALCRVARFEPSPLVARHAALGIVERDWATITPEVAAACRAELGASRRTPAAWIRLWLAEGEGPAAVVADWGLFLEAEIGALKRDSLDTDAEIVERLASRHLDFCDAFGTREETFSAIELRIALGAASDESLQAALAGALQWIIDRRRGDLLDRLEELHRRELHGNRVLLYYFAIALDAADRGEEAQRLADEAFRKEDEGGGARRIAVAGAIADKGRLAWAKREYQRVIDSAHLVSENSMNARVKLAAWLADREDYAAAADLLDEFCDAVNDDQVARQKLVESFERHGLDGRDAIDEAVSLSYFYRAAGLEAAKDYRQQRKFLKLAVKTYERNPDFLIAMYRSPEAPADFREETLARIRRLAKQTQDQIDEFPDAAGLYNQWAWLVANTEGDYARAVEYSQKSLELSPDEPSFLDTLGRCHYAAGDLAKAVEAQRQAVELAPQYEVMKRQLALFENELARRDAAGDPPSAAQKSGD
jgi:tetratricopeptide (TPR) repeat protein